MSMALQKLLKRLHNDDPDANDGSNGGEGGGDDAALRREQELEASRHGWVPKSKFKGPQEQWKDAATFLKDGQNFKGALQSEVARLKRELEEFKGTAKQFAEFQQRQIEQRDSEIADLMKDLKRQQREAIRDGDDATADAIDDRIELLQEERGNVRKQLKSTKQDDPNGGEGAGPGKIDPSQGIDENGYTTNPIILGFINDGNEWLRDNKTMRDYSFSIANDLIQAGETKRGVAFLQLIREKMEEAFPRYFGEGRSNPGARGSLNESGGSGRSGGSYSEADLPPEDLELMKLGIRQGWTTKEVFLKNYFSEGPRVHRTSEKR